MKKQILHTITFSLTAIFLVACGSNSKPDASDLNPVSTALSIVYDSTTETSSGKMIGHYHVHAVNDAGKPMSGMKLKFALVNGVKEIHNQKVQKGTGNIYATTPISFNDANVNFAQSGVSRGDALIVLPSSGKTSVSYLGGWKIAGISENLTFEERSFNLDSTEGVTYIVGNEERLLGGTNGNRGILAVAHIAKVDQNGTSVTDKNGFTYFDVVFDPILSGHTIAVGVHTASNNRLGTSSVLSLRGADFQAAPYRFANSGATYSIMMSLGIYPQNGGGEHLIDVDINPSSFKAEPEKSCHINYAQSHFHTSAGGNVLIVVDTVGATDSNSTESGDEICTLTWDGGIESILFEY